MFLDPRTLSDQSTERLSVDGSGFSSYSTSLQQIHLIIRSTGFTTAKAQLNKNVCGMKINTSVAVKVILTELRR